MVLLRGVLALGLLFSALVVPAHADDTSWLIGTWVGDIRNQAKGSKSGPTRTLLIKGVHPDGTLDAGWSASGNPRVGNSTGKLAGITIMLKTGEDAEIELTKASDGTLNGTYRSSGKPYPITMTKQ